MTLASELFADFPDSQKKALEFDLLGLLRTHRRQRVYLAAQGARPTSKKTLGEKEQEFLEALRVSECMQLNYLQMYQSLGKLYGDQHVCIVVVLCQLAPLHAGILL